MDEQRYGYNCLSQSTLFGIRLHHVLRGCHFIETLWRPCPCFHGMTYFLFIRPTLGSG